MKTLQNNFTTPEQSKRLLELGVPAWTADCFFYEEGGISDDAYPEVVPFGEKYEDASKEEMFTSYVSLPCWSVGRLIEIFELCTSSKFERIKTKCSVLEDILWQIEVYVTETSKGFSIDFSKLEELV